VWLVGRTVGFIRKVDAAPHARHVERRNHREMGHIIRRPTLIALRDVAKTQHFGWPNVAPGQHVRWLTIGPFFESSKSTIGKGALMVAPRVIAVMPAVVVCRQSLPQPIHRAAWSSRPARNWLLFSQTSESESAKNHLGPPQ
jgi:hypothetical protein